VFFHLKHISIFALPVVCLGSYKILRDSHFYDYNFQCPLIRGKNVNMSDTLNILNPFMKTGLDSNYPAYFHLGMGPPLELNPQADFCGHY